MDTTQERLLRVAAGLFADKGYSGVSMRAIAVATGITQAAIYHHFANKEDLYFAAVRYLHEDIAASFIADLSAEIPPEERLALLVRTMLTRLAVEADFRRIYFRELLETDQQRLREMVVDVFSDVAEVIEKLMGELAPARDSHLLFLSLMSLIIHHLEARKLSALLPGGRPEHAELAVLADHITTLLLHGVQTS